MGRYSILYARTADAGGLSRVTQHAVVSTPDPEWLAVVDAEDEVGALVETVAQDLGVRAVSIEYHSVVDWVQVRAWDGTGEPRTLSYSGGGDGWEVVEGSPEPWEARLFDRGDAEPEDLSDVDRRALDTRTLLEGARQPHIAEEDVVRALGVPDPWRVLHPPGIRWNGQALIYLAVSFAVIGVVAGSAGTNNGWVYGAVVAGGLSLGNAWLYRRLGGSFWLYRRVGG